MYPAHFRINIDKTIIAEQSVRAHCKGTAARAREALIDVGLGYNGELAGWLHDMGKCKDEFKDYLISATTGKNVERGSVIHSFAGVRYLFEKYHAAGTEGSAACYTSEIIACAIGSHHGLFDLDGPSKVNGFSRRLEASNIHYDESRTNFIKECLSEKEIAELFQKATHEMEVILPALNSLPAWEDKDTYYCSNEAQFYVGLLTRLLSSALIEGDRSDTASFMSEGRASFEKIADDSLWEKCLSRIEEKINGFPCENPIDQMRRKISDMCRKAAGCSEGVLRLNVPTGAGKTLSSLRFAVAHARAVSKKRIFFVSPLLTILEQNAAVIRNAVGDDSIILEHHSNVVRDGDDSETVSDNELLCENWHSPIVITTMVQLLNSLFSGKSSSIRRFHSLCYSVIVIDEVQMIPTHMLSMFNLAVNFLSEVCHATVVLCSATQPCLEETDHPLAKDIPQLVPFDKSMWRVFKRTEIIDAGVKDYKEIAAFSKDILAERRSLLIICNKKEEAEQLFGLFSDIGVDLFHLSASMCHKHREIVLEEIKNSLSKEGAWNRTVCIATQVIEAGVDISFACVIRLTAGLDSIVQSAGRCNRNAEDTDPAPVYVVRLQGEDLSRLSEIRRAKNASIELLNAFDQNPEKFSSDLMSEDAVGYYYSRLYKEMETGYQDYPLKQFSTSIYGLLSGNERFRRADHSYCLCQAFQTAGRFFSVFDENTMDAIVPYGEGNTIIVNLQDEGIRYDYFRRKELLDKAKGYTISLFAYQKRRLEEEGGIYYICDGTIAVIQDGYYDKKTGMTLKKKQMAFMEV